MNIYLGEEGKTTAPLLRIQQEEGEWLARHYDNDETNRPLDDEKWAEYVPLVGGPRQIGVEAYKVRDRDYVDWGIGKEGHSIEIRFSGLTERGTRFTDGVLFLIGNKTEDGAHYFAIPASDTAASPVVLLDAKWAEKLFDLVSNVPYAEETTESQPG